MEDAAVMTGGMDAVVMADVAPSVCTTGRTTLCARSLRQAPGCTTVYMAAAATTGAPTLAGAEMAVRGYSGMF